MSDNLARLFARRFPTDDTRPDTTAVAGRPGGTTLEGMAGRGSCRAFTNEAPGDALVDVLAAIALSAPTKSDLQQRDIVVVRDQEIRDALDACVPAQAWLAGAPLLLVFCGNNRRQRLIHEWWGRPFANDHMDAPFNAAVDAGIALGAFVTAAEAMGLGTCPVSGLRDRADQVSELLGLPDHVFPVAGLALGYPAAPPPVSPRLPLRATLHRDRYGEGDLRAEVAAYDAARAEMQPYARQRASETFGTAETYTWSDDKTRQYARPERAGFGAFLRRKGFRLD